MGSNPMFPNMLYSYSPYYVLSLANISRLKKNLSFYIKYTKKTSLVVKFFKKINFFENYVIVKINNVLYFKVTPFYYKNLSYSAKFKIISNAERKYFISLKALVLINKRSGRSIYVISTSRGLMTHKMALKKKTSGFLLGFFAN